MLPSAQDQTRGRHPGAGGDEHVLDPVDLVDGGAAQLAYTFGAMPFMPWI